MGIVGISFVAACAVVVGINGVANHLSKGKLIDARGVSVMLMLMCAASNVVFQMSTTNREILSAFPVMDAMALVTMYAVSIRQPRIWKVGVGLCLLSELFVHAIYLPGIEDGLAGPNAASQYYLLLDILFALQLLFTVWPGGLSLGRYCLSALSRLRMSRHGVLAG